MNESTVARDLRVFTGGADRDRTDDPRLAKPVLSQLSYSPLLHPRARRLATVGLARLELATLPLSGVRSNHLSYRPFSLQTAAPDEAPACSTECPARQLQVTHFQRPSISL